MTFNGISWGYIDSDQARQYSYSSGQILKMLRRCSAEGGNLLINIGPTADGTVPSEAKEPLDSLGKWLSENGEATYGKKAKLKSNEYFTNNISQPTASDDKKTLYAWIYSYPSDGMITFGGFKTAPRRITVLSSGEEVKFTLDGERIKITDLPSTCPDKHVGVCVLKLEFDDVPRHAYGSYYPQLHYGRNMEG